MIRPPRDLQVEITSLTDEYYSLEEADTDSKEEMRQWFYKHASELLKLYYDFRCWIGDEGQLCDGHGNPLYMDNRTHEWIQDWDVNEQGFCVFPGTDKLILNTDGMAIKDPVMDTRLDKLYVYDRFENYIPERCFKDLSE